MKCAGFISRKERGGLMINPTLGSDFTAELMLGNNLNPFKIRSMGK